MANRYPKSLYKDLNKPEYKYEGLRANNKHVSKASKKNANKQCITPKSL